MINLKILIWRENDYKKIMWNITMVINYIIITINYIINHGIKWKMTSKLFTIYLLNLFMFVLWMRVFYVNFCVDLFVRSCILNLFLYVYALFVGSKFVICHMVHWVLG